MPPRSGRRPVCTTVCFSCLVFFNDVVLVLLNLSKSHLASLWLRSDRDVDFSGRPVLTGWLPTFLADNGIVLFVWGLQANHGFKPGIKFFICLF